MDINELQKNLGQNSFKTSFLQGVTKTSQIREFRNCQKIRQIEREYVLHS